MASMIPSLRASAEPAVGPAALVWATGAAAMVALDGRVDLASLAMLMVLTAAVAAVWLPAWAALAGSALGVLAFNWTFIPPRGSFAVDLRQHALLLGTMLAVSAIVTLLMAALRRQAAHAARQAARAEQLRAWADALRDTDDPSTQAGALQAALTAMTGAVVTVQVLKDRLPPSDDDAALLAVGTADADRRAGLWHCLRDGRPWTLDLQIVRGDTGALRWMRAHGEAVREGGRTLHMRGVMQDIDAAHHAEEALREADCDLPSMACAFLEADGRISILKKPAAAPGAAG